MYIFGDVETTGVDPRKDCIVQVAGAILDENADVIIKDGKPLEFSEYVYPERPMSRQALLATGIDMNEVLSADDSCNVSKRFAAFTREVDTELILVAHRASFDYGFFREWQIQEGVKFNWKQPEADEIEGWKEPPYICTLALARKLLTKKIVGNHQLKTLVQHFGRELKGAHNAQFDVQGGVFVFKNLLKLQGVI
jgi:DNA polymerase-3 subunit epsilon